VLKRYLQCAHVVVSVWHMSRANNPKGRALNHARELLHDRYLRMPSPNEEGFRCLSSASVIAISAGRASETPSVATQDRFT